MEDFLIDEIDNSLKRNDNMRVKILMDAYRGTRLSKVGSSYPSSYEMVNRLKTRNINRDVDIGLFRNSPVNLLTNTFRLTEVNEIQGVHHMKICIFDDNVIVTGANFEEQYFLNRKDRYWIINECKELSDYLEDLVLTMMTHSDRIDLKGNINHSTREKQSFKQLVNSNIQQNNLFSYISNNTIQQPISYDDIYTSIESTSSESDNKNIVKCENISIRDNIVHLLKDNNISTIMNKIHYKRSYTGDINSDDEYVYIMPMQQNKTMNIQQEEQFIDYMIDILYKNSICMERIYYSSAYMNPPYYIFDRINMLDSERYDIVTSSKECNGFYGARGIKGYIPHFYQRVYRSLFDRSVNDSNKDRYKYWLYSKNGWTFHSKQIYMKTVYNDVLTTIGSSNFNKRSFNRDNELTLFVYSNSKKFDDMMKYEIDETISDCLPFDRSNVYNIPVYHTICDYILDSSNIL